MGKFNEVYGKLWSLRTRRDRSRAKPKLCHVCSVPVQLGQKSWRCMESVRTRYICTDCMPEG